MAMSAEHMSKFAAFHRQWWRLHMSEKCSSGTINSTQTNKNKETCNIGRTESVYVIMVVSPILH